MSWRDDAQLGRLVFWSITGLALALGAWNALGFWPIFVDDAWISLRYARNLALGLGPIYNPGERVEGFSNPVWTALLAGWLRLHDNGALGVKLLSLGAHLGCVALAPLLARRLARPSSALGEAGAAAAGLVVALSLPLNYWAAAGLESSQYVAALLGSLLALEHERERPGHPPISALLGALAALSRPEAPLLVLPVLLGRLLHFRRDRDLRALLRWGLVFGVPTVGYLSFRLGYYGLVLPNTAYVKGGQATVAELRDYLLPWLALEPLLALGGALGLGLALRARRWDALPLVGMALGGAVFVARVGGDWMPNQRYAVPVIALLAVGVGFGAATLLERVAPRARPALAGALALLLALQGWRSLGVEEAGTAREGAIELTPRPEQSRLPASLEQPVGNASLAAWLLERAAPDATIAVSTIGVVGYVADWRIIDIFGLVTPEVTRLEPAALMSWLRRQEPDWIVLRDLNIDRFRKLRRARWLYEDFELVEGPSEAVWVGRRRDTPLATDEQVLANLREAMARAPNLIELHRLRVKWAFAVGDRAEREATCEALRARFPEVQGLNARCERLDRRGKGRPEVPMTPLDVEPPARKGADEEGEEEPGTSAAP